MKLLINKSEIEEVIPKNKIFTVTFVKQDGTIRRLTGRKGVKKYLTDAGLRYEPESRRMFTMFEMKSLGYRLIKLDNIQRMKINGVEYEITG